MSNRDLGVHQTGGRSLGVHQASGSGPQTCDPGGISTGFSAGTPDVIGPAQTCDPGGIPTGFAAGLPNFGGPQTIALTNGVPTGIRIGVPNVAGPVNVDNGVPTGFSAGTPLMRQEVTLGFNGISTGFSAGSPKLFHSQTIALGNGIPTGFSAGVPTFVPGQQRIQFRNFDGIPTGFRTGVPNFTGGGAGLHIYIAGVDVSSLIQANAAKAGVLRYGAAGSSASSAGAAQPMQLTSQTTGRWESQFDIIDYDGTLNPDIGQTVLIVEPNYRHFGGCITKREIEYIMGTDTVIYHITARDKSAICDRRLIYTPFYPAGMDMADVFRAIVRDYLNGEGFTTVNVPPSLGPLTADYVLPGQYPTVTQGFDGLVALSNGVWWVDSFGDLHTPLVSDIPDAPYSLSIPLPTGFRGLRMVSDSSTYANKVIGYSNLKTIPGTSLGNSGSPAEATTASIDETYTLPQAKAAALGYVLGSILTQFPIKVITKITVDGIEQPVHLASEQINFEHAWWYFPGAPNNFVIPPNAQNNNPFPDPPVTSPDPTSGQVVVVSYIPDVPLAGSSTGSPLNPDGPGTGTCGSGLWEKAVLFQNISYQGDLQILADAVRTLDGIIQKQLNFETDVPGALVGGKLTVDLSRLQLPSVDLLITAVQGTSQNGVDLGFGSCLRWTITAVNGADQGNAVKFWERVINRSEAPLPIDQLVLPTIILAPGVDLTSGVVDPNPCIVATTCEATEVAVSCFEGPIDEDLFIDLQVNGVSILAAPIKVPAGTASLDVITSDAMSTPGGTWLYQNQVVVPVVSYTVTGANPTPAQSVTVQVRGHY